MLKAFIISLFISLTAFGQIDHSITLVDSSAVSDSVLIPGGYFLSSVRTGDLNKISELEFDFKFGTTGSWFTLAVPDSNFAIPVKDNVIVPLPKSIFEGFKGRSGYPVYFRFDPNDSDTTSRVFTIMFDNK